MRRRLPLSAILLVVFVASVALWRPAHASHRANGDEGLWLWVEYRQPIIGRANTPAPRFSMRFVSDTRLFFKTRGLDEQFVRVGLIYDVNRWFWIALNGTVYVDRQVPSLQYQEEGRLEIEPHITGRIGNVSIDDRNRLEFRVRSVEVGANPVLARVRYRNMLRINYDPPKWRVFPFIWNEWLFNLDRGYDQNRLAGGIALRINSYIRLDFTYVFRSIRPATTGPWSQDHVLLFYLFVGLPPKH